MATETHNSTTTKTDASLFLRQPENFFFENAEIKQNLDLLLHLTQSSNLLVLVSGGEGTGKSTLLTHFIRRLPKGHLAVPLMARPDLDQRAVLAAMARGLDLPDDIDKTALMHLVNMDTIKRNQRDQYPILVVDDAHTLAGPTLNMILQMAAAASETKGCWHVVLCGTPLLEGQVAQFTEQYQLQLNSHILQLTPLSQADTKSYLHQRLQAASHSGPSPFTDEQFLELYKSSGGRIEEIDKRAYLLLNQSNKQVPGDRASTTSPDRPDNTETDTTIAIHATKATPMKRIFVWASLAVIVISVALWQQDAINTLFDSPIASVDEALEIPGLQTRTDSPESSATEDTTLKPAGTVEASDSPAPDRMTITEDPLPDPAAATRSTMDTAAVSPGGSDAESATDTGTGTSDAQIARFNDPPPVAAAVPDEHNDITQAAPGPVQTAPNTSPDKVSDGTADQTQATEDKPLASINANATLINTDKRLSADKGAAWLLRQPAQSYSLQLLGSRNETTVRNIIARSTDDQLAYYRVLYKDQPWYVLVKGSYADAIDAQQAARQLPAALGGNSAWIRPLKDIQAEIRRGHK